MGQVSLSEIMRIVTATPFLQRSVNTCKDFFLISIDIFKDAYPSIRLSPPYPVVKASFYNSIFVYSFL